MNLSVSFLKARQKEQVLVRVLACLLLVLPACRIPELHQAEPPPSLPAGFNAATSGCDLRLIYAIKDVSVIPPEGKNLIIVAAVGSVLHFRIFDQGGNNVVDTDETKLPTKAKAIADLKKKLESLRPPHKLTEEEKSQAITAATSIVDYTPTSLENSSQLGIEEFYNDPLLTGLIHQALAGNRELKILDQEVRIAGNEILARQGAYLPFVTIGAGAGLAKPSVYSPEGALEGQLEYSPGKHFQDPLATYLAGINFSWQLDIWRQLRNARDAAAQRYTAAFEKRNYFVTRLVADIAESFYTLMALDKRIETLDKTIELQEQSLEAAKAKFDAGRVTELPVQRFQAEVRKNQSEKLIIKQEIVEIENRVNFLINRYPGPVERMSTGFFDLNIHALSVGMPSQLLQNRPDIRQAERELAATGLDVQVARARFYPSLAITGGVGYQALNPRYLFLTPESLVYNVAGNLVAPLINFKAIQADYLTANAKQLQAVYNYQRVILNAFTEVVNRVSMVENYRKSIELKKQQLEALETSVGIASKLFLAARTEYIEVLFAQRDLQDARMVLIDTKKQQLSAIVNAYQALGGGDLLSIANREPRCTSGWSEQPHP
jgi:outer membrane protein, multidrug efflux system